MSLTGRDIAQAFAALRLSGARAPFDPSSDEEIAAIRFFGQALTRHGVGPAELEVLVTSYCCDPTRDAAFPLPWPNPGALLSYRPQPRRLAMDSEFLALVKIANATRRPEFSTFDPSTGEHGGELREFSPAQQWDQALRRRYPGGIPETIAAALEEVGGAEGLRAILSESEIPWTMKRFREAGEERQQLALTESTLAIEGS